MTREMVKQIECDYWREKESPIDMAEIFDLAQKALDQEPSNSENSNKSEILTGSTTKNNLGVDCIDRAELLKAMNTWDKFGYSARYGLERLDKDDKGFVPYVKYEDMVNCVKNMPSVAPQPRKGHWIWELDETPSTPISPYELNYAGWVCSCCHKFPDDVCEWDEPDEPPTYKFCPNCGTKMESEG